MATIDFQGEDQTFSSFEIKQLQQSKIEFERSQKIRFINLQSYINHLVHSINKKLDEGQFVPRSIEEARAGYYLP